MPRTRKSGDGGLYFDKKRELWVGVIDHGFTSEGRRRQVRVTSRSQEKARDKLTAKIDEIKQHGSPLGNRKVEEWGAVWLSTVKPRMKPQPFRAYESVLRTWVTPVIGRKNVKDVRPSDLNAIYAHMRAEGKASSTLLKVHNVMSAMFEAARLEGLTGKNVTNDVRPPRASKSTRDTFTMDETARILAAALTVRNGSKWLVSLYAGIRQGERLGATLDSVDFDRGEFTVRWNLVEGNYDHGCGAPQGKDASGKPAYPCGRKHSGHCPQKRLVVPEGIDYRLVRGRLMLVPPKSGEPRTFPLPGPLLKAIRSDIGKLVQNPYGLLWPAEDGNPVEGREDQAEWKELLKVAEVTRPDATTHWARHTAVSDFTAAGIPERVIGEIVGHRSAGITGRYQHVTSRDAAAAMEKLGERRQLES